MQKSLSFIYFIYLFCKPYTEYIEKERNEK